MIEKRGIHVLGIESSCDDTGVAIVNNNHQALSNCIHSQLKEHLSHGGIIPVLAKEYHLENIDRVANDAFKKSGLKSIAKDVDAIAVSTRPGLQFSLQVGLNYARSLAKKYSKPLIKVHHMQAHALMPLLENKSIRFPFMTLLISGGHCILALARRYNDFHLLGSTRDEAPGDILDKVARRLKLKNLGPPFDSISGGAAIELLSGRTSSDRYKYFNSFRSIPMLTVNTCEFSFSGYRSSLDFLMPMVDNLWLSGNQEALLKELSDICASLQRIMLIQLVKKLQRAVMFYKMHWRYQNEDCYATAKTNSHLGYQVHRLDSASIDLVISGGVAANNYFIESIRTLCRECIDPDIRVYTPSKGLCNDNGLMVAWNGLLHYQNHLSIQALGEEQRDVISDPKQMDLVDVEPESLMGRDLTDDVKQARFKLTRMQHPEIKVKQD